LDSIPVAPPIASKQSSNQSFTRYSIAEAGKRVRNTNLYHSRQSGIVGLLHPCSGRIDYTQPFALWKTTPAENCKNNSLYQCKLGVV